MPVEHDLDIRYHIEYDDRLRSHVLEHMLKKTEMLETSVRITERHRRVDHYKIIIGTIEFFKPERFDGIPTYNSRIGKFFFRVFKRRRINVPHLKITRFRRENPGPLQTCLTK